MPTPDEIRASAERLKRVKELNQTVGLSIGEGRLMLAQVYFGPNCGVPDDAVYYGQVLPVIKADREILADAYISHLDAQAAREAERNLLVDEEWLLTNQFKPVAYSGWRRGKVTVSPLRNVSVETPACYVLLVESATRGQVLDLMSALKGE